MIEPFNLNHLTPNGYDLSIDEVEFEGKIYKLEEVKEIKVPPKTFFKVLSMETVNLTKDLVAHLWLRSSYAKKGIMATFGFVDAGFHGKIIMSLYNTTNDLFCISYSGKKTICQIVFEHFSGAKKDYSERSGTYQNQRSLK